MTKTHLVYDFKAMTFNKDSVDAIREALNGRGKFAEFKHRTVMSAFTWKHTPEGADYWSDVYTNRIPEEEWMPRIEAMLAQAAIRGVG